MKETPRPQPSVLRAALLCVVVLLSSTRFVSAEDEATTSPAWWNRQWKQRAEVPIPPETHRLLRVPLPDKIHENAIRCILPGHSQPLAHWVQQMEISQPTRVAQSPEVHYGFPRVVRAATGNLLLFYRVGTTHASDDSQIAMRRSEDNGRTWLQETTLWKAPAGRSAHNPVALVTPEGRVILWVSDYQYSLKPTVRRPGLWSHSLDHGKTWSPFIRFDDSPLRSSYYITEAVVTSDGILAADAAFPPSGVGNCHVPIWHSADAGQTWSVRSYLTSPEENKGNEVALLETKPGTILCILRDRQHEDTYRFWSHDAGRTWSKPEPLGEMLDCLLQRPFLARLDAKTLLLSGRDARRKLVVAYLSRDNGQTFGGRHVLDSFQKDGGYTASLKLDETNVLITWYSDSGTTPLKPDIKTVILSLVDRDKFLWIRLPEETSPEKTKHLHVYFGNDQATKAEDRTMAILRPPAWTDATISQVQP